MLYGFGGNGENIDRHFTPIEQVYKEIDLNDTVLVAQLRTCINLVKDNSTKKVRFSIADDQNEQKHIADL